jgi:hypothetical protein
MRLESIQRRATKLIRGIRQLPYMERFESLNLPLLIYRRKRGDIIQTYKYIQGLSKGDVDKLLPIHQYRRTRA